MKDDWTRSAVNDYSLGLALYMLNTPKQDDEELNEYKVENHTVYFRPRRTENNEDHA